MLDQVQYTDSYQLTQYQACINVLKPLYNRFISSRFRRRRNVNHAKLTDIEVIALLCFQVVLGITVRTRFYDFLLRN